MPPDFQFPVLVSFVTSIVGRQLDCYEIEELHQYLPAPTPEEFPCATHARDLMNAMGQGRRIDAIKSYRSLTGDGLKEAKDIVESVIGWRPME